MTTAQQPRVVATGDRVRLTHPSPILALRARLGTLERQEDSGYWIVRLDEPADYIDRDGDTRQLDCIRESEGNFSVVATGGT